MQKVTFELEDCELVGAVNRPKAWPDFRAYRVELHDVLANVVEWEVCPVKRAANRPTFLIARSVTKDRRYQSYVAQGSPAWIRRLLVDEGTRS